MVKKLLASKLLRRLPYGQVTMNFWDGTSERFGTNGPRVEIALRDPVVLRRLPLNASLAMGEAYMNGQLEIDDLSNFFDLVFRNRLPVRVPQLALRQQNRRGRQQRQIAHHYDVSNDYYGLFLDPTMAYSCAYFCDEEDPLEQAQYQKFEHVLRKLRLQPGQRLLDIGCGWGHLAVTAAKRYNVKVLGITLSEEQLRGARELAEREGVSDLVTFELMNYQEVEGGFERVVSVGMFEHVGRGQHGTYFDRVSDLLTPNGISLLHTITTQREHAADAWVSKYIFPGGYLPTVAGIEGELARHGLWSIDRENLWQHYAWTLREWAAAHQAQRDQIIDMFDVRFFRMRQFWLEGSRAAFQHGDLGLAQIIFSKGKPQEWPTTRAFMTAP